MRVGYFRRAPTRPPARYRIAGLAATDDAVWEALHSPPGQSSYRHSGFKVNADELNHLFDNVGELLSQRLMLRM